MTAAAISTKCKYSIKKKLRLLITLLRFVRAKFIQHCYIWIKVFFLIKHRTHSNEVATIRHWIPDKHYKVNDGNFHSEEISFIMNAARFSQMIEYGKVHWSIYKYLACCTLYCVYTLLWFCFWVLWFSLSIAYNACGIISVKSIVGEREWEKQENIKCDGTHNAVIHTFTFILSRKKNSLIRRKMDCGITLQNRNHLNCSIFTHWMLLKSNKMWT